MDNKGQTFAEKHPKLNTLFGLVLFLLLVAGGIYLLNLILVFLKNLFTTFGSFLSNFVSSTDKVIVVAMITGTVSITGVVISSIIAKIVDYRFNVKKLLYDKREVPYEQFIEMVYSIMEDTKKPENKRMTEEEINKKVSEFSRGLTLWGSNRVVKKWIKYRKNAAQNPDNENLFLLEQILYEMRKDVGLRRKMKKGVMLSFFINDIENALKK
ncbi:hypothetical protein IV49_GL000732 [Kandleria vitulina DSM 20405]|uniref:Uncharacterized protein n=1 Tax=Kandleria vitulina DSM 20405 TaxID=1410657 RepID=A0A0R2HE09_9FIRM|nr:hypothetical protein [Kandleria vitulina]KRN51267.1 hypothetical protein IV49_GL000732 [Kandleria vitulina DSM 20405]SDM19164.1 hypothetical protein SAMN05216520_1334 [Kandleria vitulina]SEJ06979.1 hypothetical protein SAMN05216514_10991 [Kandleria vitulina]